MTLAVIKKINDMGSTYFGMRNESGQRDGMGKCIYLDGSTYEGSWLNDKREGHGLLTERNGSVYTGNWHNDMRHGEGRQELHSGICFEGPIWVKDRKHGRGFVVADKDKSQERKEAVFVDDMVYVLSDQNPSMFCNAQVNLLLCILAISLAFSAYYFYESKWILFIAAFVYFAQLVECYSGAAYGFFKNQIHLKDLEEYLRRIQQQHPTITMVYQNIRHEHHNGKHKEVNKERFTQEYRYHEYIDESPDFNTFDAVQTSSMTRLELAVDVRYSPVASSSLEAQRAEFERNSKKEEHGTGSTTVSTGDMLSHMIVYKSQPLILNSLFYTLCNLCMMSWVIRVMLVFNSQRVEYTFQKYILK